MDKRLSIRSRLSTQHSRCPKPRTKTIMLLEVASITIFQKYRIESRALAQGSSGEIRRFHLPLQETQFYLGGDSRLCKENCDVFDPKLEPGFMCIGQAYVQDRMVYDGDIHAGRAAAVGLALDEIPLLGWPEHFVTLNVLRPYGAGTEAGTEGFLHFQHRHFVRLLITTKTCMGGTIFTSDIPYLWSASTSSMVIRCISSMAVWDG
ncbi:hypothetical protein BJ170DRAFT_714583 [Xylariales sp. AK1849]|nr:hypothetical protein BJ170DRAFT_714583 [Xylariales sp. AK1849]